MTEVTTVTAAPEGRRGDLHVGWVMPPFFHELPVDAENVDEAGDRLGELVTTILAEGSEDDQITMFALYLQITAQLAEAGAEYAGFCLLDMEGRRSTATVAVYRMALEKITAGEALSEAYSALSRAYPDDDVQVSTLPSGRGTARPL